MQWRGRKIGFAIQSTSAIDFGDAGWVGSLWLLVHTPYVINEGPELFPDLWSELHRSVEGEEKGAME